MELIGSDGGATGVSTSASSSIVPNFSKSAGCWRNGLAAERDREAGKPGTVTPLGAATLGQMRRKLLVGENHYLAELCAAPPRAGRAGSADS